MQDTDRQIAEWGKLESVLKTMVGSAWLIWPFQQTDLGYWLIQHNMI